MRGRLRPPRGLALAVALATSTDSDTNYDESERFEKARKKIGNMFAGSKASMQSKAVSFLAMLNLSSFSFFLNQIRSVVCLFDFQESQQEQMRKKLQRQLQSASSIAVSSAADEEEDGSSSVTVELLEDMADPLGATPVRRRPAPKSRKKAEPDASTFKKPALTSRSGGEQEYTLKERQRAWMKATAGPRLTKDFQRLQRSSSVSPVVDVSGSPPPPLTRCSPTPPPLPPRARRSPTPPPPPPRARRSPTPPPSSPRTRHSPTPPPTPSLTRRSSTPPLVIASPDPPNRSRPTTPRSLTSNERTSQSSGRAVGTQRHYGFLPPVSGMAVNASASTSAAAMGVRTAEILEDDGEYPI